MKTITIGSFNYKLCENAEDLGIKRFTEMKALIVLKETGISAPSLLKHYQAKIVAYNSKSPADMLIEDYNFYMGVKAINEREDTDQLIFGLICNEKDEDITKVDNTQIKEKLGRMADNGLTQGVVKKEVDSFIQGSPILSELYFLRNLESLNLEQAK